MVRSTAIKRANPKKRRTKKLSSEEKRRRAEKSRHKNLVREILKNVGFARVLGVAGKNIKFRDIPSELDDIFVKENVLLVVEYTTSQSSNVSGHLKKKHLLYQEIEEFPIEFLRFLMGTFEHLSSLDNNYDLTQFKIRKLYASKNPVDQSIKQAVKRVFYFDYEIVEYFKSLTRAIKLSALSEFLNFLDVSNADFGEAVWKPGEYESTNRFGGYILPEQHSFHKPGYKIVSFYVQPEVLLKQSYVLRKEGWREGPDFYQRMLEKSRIEGIRKYLVEQKRVFLNNIIVTLPGETEIRDNKNKLVDPNELTETRSVKIYIPDGYNKIGLIDGQHRVFAYHEGGLFDDEISKFRGQQNLLVTGVVFPRVISDLDKRTFEAKLFLEINTNQKGVPSDLTQRIKKSIYPFSAEAIASEVLTLLNNESGPLQDKFQRFFFEKGKLKTASIVSFGIVPLVKLDTEGSLFSIWTDGNKAALLTGINASAVRERYIKFCHSEIRRLLIGARSNLPAELWTPERSVQGRILSTTNVNGFLRCLRRIVASGTEFSDEEYLFRLQELKKFKFDDYKSSGYVEMGRVMYEQYFG